MNLKLGPGKIMLCGNASKNANYNPGSMDPHVVEEVSRGPLGISMAGSELFKKRDGNANERILLQVLSPLACARAKALIPDKERWAAHQTAAATSQARTRDAKRVTRHLFWECANMMAYSSKNLENSGDNLDTMTQQCYTILNDNRNSEKCIRQVVYST